MKKCLFILLLALLFIVISCDDKVNGGFNEDETKVTEITLSQVGQTSRLDVEITASSIIKKYKMQVFSTFEDEEIEINAKEEDIEIEEMEDNIDEEENYDDITDDDFEEDELSDLSIVAEEELED